MSVLPMPGNQGGKSCYYCGGWHSDRICPRIKRIEYHPDGTVRRVSLRDPIEYAFDRIAESATNRGSNTVDLME